MKKTKVALGVVACAAVLMLFNVSANAQPTVEPSTDYCADYQRVLDNPAIGMIPPEFAWILDLFAPPLSDVNGMSTIDVTGEDIVADIHGNGMRDCGCELGLVAAVADDPLLDLSATGGITYAIFNHAWKSNDATLAACIGEEYWPLLVLIEGLGEILSGWLIIGDGSVVEDPEDDYTVEGFGGLVSGLLEILANEEILEQPDLAGLGNYTLLTQYFAADGDADGDGWTNREEYDEYGPGSKADPDCAEYVANALDPNVHPTGGEGEGEGEGMITGGGYIEEGSTLNLQMIDPTYVSYQWKKDGVAIGGATSASYSISSVIADDSGSYSCDVDDETKAIITLGPVPVTVVAAGSLPVAAFGGLALAAMACVGAGAMAIRRRK